MRAEWDFQFYADGTVAFVYIPQNQTFRARYDENGKSSDGVPVNFEMTVVPPNSVIPDVNGNLLFCTTLMVHVDGDILSGVFKTAIGQSGITRFLYIALGKADAAEATFDTGMDGFEFVLVGCQNTQVCSFARAIIPEN